MANHYPYDPYQDQIRRLNEEMRMRSMMQQNMYPYGQVQGGGFQGAGSGCISGALSGTTSSVLNGAVVCNSPVEPQKPKDDDLLLLLEE